MAKRVVIIGAGIAGLSAGCYACMNGYDVEIHEAQRLPGGLCTAWKRQGYIIDGCVHWLIGSRPGTSLYEVWEELGAIQGRDIYDHELFFSYAGCDGRTVHFYTNTARLRDHLMALSPGDADAIAELCRFIQSMARLEVPVGKPAELMRTVDLLKLMLKYGPTLKDLAAAQDVTLGELGARFSDPLLRQAITHAFVDPSLPAMSLVSTLGMMEKHVAGYPLGGSLPLAQAIEGRFRQLGGRIVYKSRVAQVIEHDGQAAGVQLDDGTMVEADWIISACDLRSTLFKLLDGSRIDPVHSELLNSGKLCPPCMLVTFGVDLDLSDTIACLGTTYELEQPIELAGRQQSTFNVHTFAHDPSLAPQGKSIVQCLITADWAYWEQLRDDRAAYQAAKDELQATCLAQLERIRPGFGAHVEMADVATPLTFEHYTDNWQGCYMTWQLGTDFQQRHRYIPKTVPGLGGFYIASMWTNAPGGLPSAALAGREVVQLLCHEDKKRFVTARP